MEDIQEAIDKGQNNVVIGMVISLCSLLNDKFNWSEQNITELTEVCRWLHVVMEYSQ